MLPNSKGFLSSHTEPSNHISITHCSKDLFQRFFYYGILVAHVQKKKRHTYKYTHTHHISSNKNYQTILTPKLAWLVYRQAI